MRKNNHHTQVMQANATATRLWFEYRAFTFHDLLNHIKRDNLNPDGITAERYAAMISHVINNGE